MKTIEEIQAEIQQHKEKLMIFRESKIKDNAKDNRITNKIVFLKGMVTYLETCKVTEETLERDLTNVQNKIESIGSKFEYWENYGSANLPVSQRTLNHFNSLMGIDVLKRQMKTIKYLLK